MADNDDTTSGRRHTAGAFDIRNVIGMLLAIYGVILTLMGLLADPQTDKTGGTNANLWAGLALLAAGSVFVVWAKLRPIVVPEHVATPEDVKPPAH